MPPKKKGGKKTGKKEAEPDEQEEEELPSDYSYELTLEQVLQEIQDWERRLTRYQEKHRQLEQLNSQLLGAYEDSNKSRLDSVAFLKKTMEQRGDEIAELQDRLTGQRQLKEQKKEEWEQLLQRLRTEFQEMKDQLTSENNLAATKLASLEEFKREREAIIARYNSLVDAFNHMLEDHEAAKQRIHTKTLLDRDRLKKDMVTRVNHVAADFRKVSNKQMAETTKRTIRENVSIQSQLFKMSEKQVELMEENAETRKRLRQQRRRVAELERSQKEAATKFACHQRVILMLRQKKKELDLLVDEFKRREAELDSLEQESEVLRAQVEEQREEIEALALQLEDQADQVQSADAELRRAEAENEDARTSLRDAADILKLALQQPAGEADGERLLRQLRQLLTESVAKLAAAPSPAAASRPVTAATYHTDDDVPLPEEDDGVAADVAEVNAAEEDEDASSVPEVGVPSHCKPGALQLIPRPRQRIPTFRDKVRESAARRGDAAATLPAAAYKAYLLAKRQQAEAEAAAAAAAAAKPSRSRSLGASSGGGSGLLGKTSAGGATPSSLMRLL